MCCQRLAMRRLDLSTGSVAPISIATRIYGTLFCLAFLAAGLFFGAGIVRDTYQRACTYSWKPVNAAIAASDVGSDEKQNGHYLFTVEYQYAFNGRQYTSHRFAIGYQGSSDYRKAQLLLEKYPA